jgi:site-specific recombinase XerC
MLPEIVRFNKWLRRRSPHATTSVEYTKDLRLFFDWVDKPPNAVTLRDVDAFIEHCQTDLGHAIATVNRRLAAIRSFYHFLDIESDDAPTNPVLPKRHFVRQGRHLPRDVEDADIAQLFAVIESVRDRAMYLLMLRCGLRVAEVRDLSMGDLYLQPTPGSLSNSQYGGFCREFSELPQEN